MLKSFFAGTMLIMMIGCSGNSHQNANEMANIQTFACEEYDKSAWMGKTLVLQEMPVKIIVEHPCSDDCPDATVRIVKYDVPLEDCDKYSGQVIEKVVPHGIAAVITNFCVPPEAVCPNESL